MAENTAGVLSSVSWGHQVKKLRAAAEPDLPVDPPAVQALGVVSL
jgi:hypothetical protein